MNQNTRAAKKQKKADAEEKKKAEERFDAELRAVAAATKGPKKIIFCAKRRRSRPIKGNMPAVERKDGCVYTLHQFFAQQRLTKILKKVM